MAPKARDPIVSNRGYAFMKFVDRVIESALIVSMFKTSQTSYFLLGFVYSIGSVKATTLVEIPLLQTGGFYADGSLDNLPTFQNYFIGYSTTTPFPRTEERRHFFVFDLTAISTPIMAADLSLILPGGGLIADEPSETWVATGTAVPAATFMDTGLTPMEALPIFAEMGSAVEIIDPVDFGPGDDDDLLRPHAFNSDGVTFLNDHLGGLVAISGYMPSWSMEPEVDEPSELIFGHTNVVSDFDSPIDPPILTLVLIPEPSAPCTITLAVAMMLFGRRRC